MSPEATSDETSRPLEDFARLVRRLLRILRYASLGLIVLAALVVGREVAALHGLLADLHPLLGWAFLVVFLAAFAWLIVRPVLRYWAVPAALTQPGRVRREAAGIEHARRRLTFVRNYLANLLRNPRLSGRLADVEAACEAAAELQRRLSEEQDAGRYLKAVEGLESRHVRPLLAPLDEEAARVIRAEAMAVGIGTAVSMNGTVDAFIVLWRNANLVARIATIYYGRPGIRGSLFILRDVAAAMLLASQVQGLMESMGGLFGGWFGRAGSVLAGAAGDGAINSLTTVRIGYVARARCRAFAPWNESTLPEILRSVMKEVASQGAGVVKDVLSTVVKGGLVKLPAEIVKKAQSLLSGILGRDRPQPDPA